MRMAMVLVSFLAIFIVGCPLPEAYIKSSEMALENVKNLDSNIDIFATNYYRFISADTAREVDDGKMTKEARDEVLSQVMDQMSNLKEQAVINRKFVDLAHDQAHAKLLDSGSILTGIQAVGDKAPEILDFVHKLKGGK